VREELLHFIWKYKKLPLNGLISSNGDTIAIVNLGTHNHLAGPDFFNAQVRIEDQLWAGNVEIHIYSSDWYIHKHEEDSNYDNVILHVVWQDDASVFRKNGSEIPTLELKNYIPQSLLNTYKGLLHNKKRTFINCENNISNIDSFVFQNWTERLYFERLEQKSNSITALLRASQNNWEQVLFEMLLKNFGLNINGDAFQSLAAHLNFSVIKKLRSNVLQLESVFFGMSKLLEDKTIHDFYFIELKKEFEFLTKKYSLENTGVIKPAFYKLRPPNFPTIRLSQLASLYHLNENIFDQIIKASNIEELYELFDVTASAYWIDHFSFGKNSRKSQKRLTKNFIDLIVVNTILPIKFNYSNYIGKEVYDEILSIIEAIKKEENAIVSGFQKHKIKANSIKDSQALIQLHQEYCTKNKCLECVVGNTLLQGNH